MVDVLTICGSARKRSFNRAIVNVLPELSPPGMRLVPSRSILEIPHYDGDLQTDVGFPSSVEELAEAIRLADGVVIVSPEYNWSVPGVLKNSFDWVSRVPNQPFKDKPVAIQSASGGLLGGSRMQYHLRQVLASLEAIVLLKPEVIVTFVRTKVDEGGKLVDAAARDVIRQQLAAFETLIGHTMGR